MNQHSLFLTSLDRRNKETRKRILNKVSRNLKKEKHPRITETALFIEALKNLKVTNKRVRLKTPSERLKYNQMLRRLFLNVSLWNLMIFFRFQVVFNFYPRKLSVP